MCGIHLNNNNIVGSSYFQQVLNIFYITEKDVITINRSTKAEAKFIKDDDIVDYEKYLRPHYSVSIPKPNEPTSEDGSIELKKYKDHLVAR